MRLDKYLAHAGIGTRSQVKKLVRSKAVSVNGETVRKSDIEINEALDVVCVNGEEIYFEEHLYFLLNKPAGVITATNDAYQMTVMDLFDPPLPSSYFPVGRLDKDTTGLLLICNDGKLAHQLLSPRHHVEKTYVVTVCHVLTDQEKAGLEAGMYLEEEWVNGAVIDHIEGKQFHMSIQEGKFHQVKRMVAKVGNEVTALKRIQMGSLVLDEALACGEYRLLSETELEALKTCGSR